MPIPTDNFSGEDMVVKDEWHDYYNRFQYFSPDIIRPGCQPRIKEHQQARKAIVLVHGLSDSPYFMNAIGEFFFHTLGYNVYLPLLQCHGLKDPEGMDKVDLNEWKNNVGYAIKRATSTAATVSIGGLSTGGTLSFYMGATDDRITGSLYLFSAALDLAGGIIGQLKEFFLRTPLAALFDWTKPLVGINPYRYTHVDIGAAGELAKLIKETDTLQKRYDRVNPFPKRLFAAHSESDATASIDGIEALIKIIDPENSCFFRISESRAVSHASVVLEKDIYGIIQDNGTEPLERLNPLFAEMTAEIKRFAKG